VNKGVSEFHLLGRAELDDMLYQPKNDRILFAVFGISLVILHHPLREILYNDGKKVDYPCLKFAVSSASSLR
jgi:hypothetical protein